MYKTIIDSDGKDAVGIAYPKSDNGYTHFDVIILNGNALTNIKVANELIFDCEESRYKYFAQELNKYQALIVNNPMEGFFLNGCMVNIGYLRGNIAITSYIIYPDGSTDQAVMVDISGIKIISSKQRNDLIQKSVNFARAIALN